MPRQKREYIIQVPEGTGVWRNWYAGPEVTSLASALKLMRQRFAEPGGEFQVVAVVLHKRAVFAARPAVMVLEDIEDQPEPEAKARKAPKPDGGKLE